jgi:hypothetical protein
MLLEEARRTLAARRLGRRFTEPQCARQTDGVEQRQENDVPQGEMVGVRVRSQESKPRNSSADRYHERPSFDMPWSAWLWPVQARHSDLS